MKKRLAQWISNAGITRNDLTGEIFVANADKYRKYCDDLFTGKQKKRSLPGITGERVDIAFRTSQSAGDFYSRSIAHLAENKPIIDAQKIAFTRHGVTHSALITTEGISGKLFTPRGITSEPVRLAGKAVHEIASPETRVHELTSCENQVFATANSALEAEKLEDQLEFRYKVSSGIEMVDEQKKILDLAVMGYNIFISGAAGTGKSILVREIDRVLTGAGLKVCLTATRALAAENIDGVTLYSIFGIFLNRPPKKTFSVLIIDEVSLMTPRGLLILHHVCCRMKKCYTKHFGGVQVIVAGDFLQVSRKSIGEMLYDTQIFQNAFLHLKLIRPHRVLVRKPHQLKFVQILQEVREGKLPIDLMKECMHILRPGEALPIIQGSVRLFFDKDKERMFNQEKLELVPAPLETLEHFISEPNLAQPWTFSHIVHLSHVKSTDTRTITSYIDEIADRMNEAAKEQFPHYIPALHGPLVVGYHVDDEYLRSFVYEFCMKLNRSRAEDCFCAFRARVIPSCGLTMPKCGEFLSSQLSQRRLNILAKVDPSNIPKWLCDQVMSRAEDVLLQSSQIKIGAQVMVTANITSAVSNGSIGVVTDMTSEIPEDPLTLRSFRWFIKEFRKKNPSMVPRFPKVRFGNGLTEIIYPRTRVVGNTEWTKFVQINVLQIPVSLCYCLSFNRIQGLTIKAPVIVDFNEITKPMEHAVYVALTRVRDPAQLHLANINAEKIRVSEKALAFEQSLMRYESFRAIQADSEGFESAKSDFIIPRERKETVSRERQNQLTTQKAQSYAELFESGDLSFSV